MSLYVGSQKVTPIIKEGITPTGTLNISQNGTYNVTNYASAEVSVSGSSSIGIPREVSPQGVYRLPASEYTFTLPSNATNLGPSALAYAFRNSSNLLSADLSSLTTISGSAAMFHAFENCSGPAEMGMSVNLSNLTTISGSNALSYAFINCVFNTFPVFSNLTTISGSNALSYAFDSADGVRGDRLFPVLTTLTGSNALSYAFNNNNEMGTDISFPALTSNSFGSNTNQFNNMLHGVGVAVVHFPSNLQSVIGSWSDVLAGFGADWADVRFDLPATT